jgi:asparagine synthase (glutamine-hydrolysing)
MCGITGFVDLRRDRGEQGLTATVRRMTATMQHRGPDDDGAWSDTESGIAFGFRRLSIIDLTPSGHQPMLSASGRSVLAYNGEIYNAEELRPRLAQRGIAFRGHSDSEVLLEHAEAFGFEETLSALVGMFAIAWHDRRDNTLWLARDRMGEKPLYFGRFGKTFMFASELRCLRAHPEFKAEINPAAFSAYVRFGYVPPPLTIYKNVQILPPGGLIRIDASGEVSSRRYWAAEDVAFAAKQAPFNGSDDEAVDELEAILKRSVAGCMVADVPLGAFLSGGIDSSVVVALMQAQSTRPVRTFSIGFDVDGFDEAPHARAVAKHLGTAHEELYFSAQDVLDLVPRIPEIWDEPFSDSSQLPTLMVSRMARSHVTVALSGDGGDELFGGYSRYGQIENIAATLGKFGPVTAQVGQAVHTLMNASCFAPMRSLLPPLLRGRLDRWSGRIAQAAGPNSFEQMYIRLASQGLPPEEFLLAPAETKDAIWEGSLAARFPGAVERAQIIDTLTYLPGDILTKVDRASMAVSLEARAPLLDHRVFEFAWRLPAGMKRRNGDTKWALKQVLFRHVPRALVERPKMGFGVPIDVWLRGPLRDWAEDLISEERLKREGLFRPDTVRNLWNRHQSGETWQYPLWTVLMFQAWREQWGV